MRRIVTLMVVAFVVAGQSLGQDLPLEAEQPLPLEVFANQPSSASAVPFETVLVTGVPTTPSQ